MIINCISSSHEHVVSTSARKVKARKMEDIYHAGWGGNPRSSAKADIRIPGNSMICRKVPPGQRSFAWLSKGALR